jgi:RNA polymerase primary sigma factor
MHTPRHEKNSVITQYFAEIRDFPLLTKEEERELARAIQEGDEDALQELVESNLSFVAKVASEYRYLGLPFEDLLNEGNVGLIQAAQRFDPDKDTKFISYAIWWIRKAILKALSEKAHVVRMPYSQIKKFKEIRRAEKALQRALGRKPNRQEISERLDKSLAKIDRVLQYGVHETSLDTPLSEDQELAVSDVLVDERTSTPEERLLEREMTSDVGEVYAMLNDQQKTVIAYRYGLLGEPALTLQETGERMGVSRERVRQIEVQAKEKMRKLFERKRRIQAPLRRPVEATRVEEAEPEPAPDTLPERLTA